MIVPKDPFMLLSWINTQLRDHYPTLEELCKTFDLNQEEVTNKLEQVGYTYNSSNNQFV